MASLSDPGVGRRLASLAHQVHFDKVPFVHSRPSFGLLGILEEISGYPRWTSVPETFRQISNRGPTNLGNERMLRKQQTEVFEVGPSS